MAGVWRTASRPRVLLSFVSGVFAVASSRISWQAMGKRLSPESEEDGEVDQDALQVLSVQL